MKNLKKVFFKTVGAMFVFMLLLAAVWVTDVKADSDDVRPTKVKLKNLTVSRGSKFELRARLSPSYADDDYLVWSIVKGKKIICFEDREDRYGEEDVEFIALKKGTAKVCCRIRGTRKKAYATIKVKEAKKSKGTIKRVGKQKRTVEVGQEFELKVKKSGVKDRYLKWTISDRRVVGFDDDDRYGDDMDFKARRKGTVTITCTNIRTKKKVSYKVKVVRYDYDDYYDDDYYDDDYYDDDYDNYYHHDDDHHNYHH